MPTRWNPEELLVAALSQCHLLWYLHLASAAGVVVLDYTDEPVGEMTVHPDGSGEFSSVVLHPRVVVAKQDMVERAVALHEGAHDMCFIARSVAFDVGCRPVVVAGVSELLRFSAHGHPQLRATHAKTLEFTAESSVTGRATCVLGVSAELPPAPVAGPIRITIGVGPESVSLDAIGNSAWQPGQSAVLRRSGQRAARHLRDGRLAGFGRPAAVLGGQADRPGGAGRGGGSATAAPRPA